MCLMLPMIQEEQDRRNRLKEIYDNGINPYPAESHRSHTIEAVLAYFDDLETTNTQVTLCGRLISIRKHGGISFLNLKDQTGVMQIVLHKETLSDPVYTKFHNQADVGDFYEFHGNVFLTKIGEQSIKATSYRLLSKSLLPLPEKWHGLSDVEIRYRQRYLDLLANPEVMEKAQARSKMVMAMRHFLESEGFMEVETPILQTIPGGANAKPFVTYHNTLNADLYLRIAPELFLKRLLVGGFEKVFEFARCFRNEGISPQHNPEFTQIEVYWAYCDIEALIDHMKKLLRVAVLAVTGGSLQISTANHNISFENIGEKTFRDLVLEKTDIDLDVVQQEKDLRSIMENKGVHTKNIVGYGDLIDHLYKTAVRPTIIQPIFVTDYPVTMKPLAKRRVKNPHSSASVQLVVIGIEICNGFNELNNPLEQEERFIEQEALRARGSEEAQRIDTDYITALKHGMPPAAGYGIGIDRLAALLTKSTNLKEVILFPTLKPSDKNSG